jgi:hypothetical protein
MTDTQARQLCAHELENLMRSAPTRKQYCTQYGIEKSTTQGCLDFVEYCLHHEVQLDAQGASRTQVRAQPNCERATASEYQACDATVREYSACREARIERLLDYYESLSCDRVSRSSSAFLPATTSGPDECIAYDAKCGAPLEPDE